MKMLTNSTIAPHYCSSSYPGWYWKTNFQCCFCCSAKEINLDISIVTGFTFRLLLFSERINAFASRISQQYMIIWAHDKSPKSMTFLVASMVRLDRRFQSYSYLGTQNYALLVLSSILYRKISRCVCEGLQQCTTKISGLYPTGIRIVEICDERI